LSGETENNQAAGIAVSWTGLGRKLSNTSQSVEAGANLLRHTCIISGIMCLESSNSMDREYYLFEVLLRENRNKNLKTHNYFLLSSFQFSTQCEPILRFGTS
jgi:hypothetical protein